MIRKVVTILALLLCIFVISEGMVSAAQPVSGTLKCSGQLAHLAYNGIDGIIGASYMVRNFGEATITITRVVVYDGDGNVRCDVSNLGTIDPHRIGYISTNDMLAGAGLGCQNPIDAVPAPHGNLQVLISWSGGKPGDISGSVMVNFVDTTNKNFNFSTIKCD